MLKLTEILILQLGELPEGEKNGILEQLDTAERAAMEEKLETSYRQIREYQDTLFQSQEQMDGARAFIESSEVSCPRQISSVIRPNYAVMHPVMHTVSCKQIRTLHLWSPCTHQGKTKH